MKDEEFDLSGIEKMSRPDSRDPHAAIDYIIRHSATYAAAKAARIQLEEFRKSKKALLMQESDERTMSAQERDAYAHEDYQQLLNDLKNAVAVEEHLRWMLVAAQMRVEVWKTEMYSNTRLEKVTM